MLTKEEQERYNRQILIDKIGIEGQEKLKKSSVLIVGVGGLGSPISMYLAASGVGRIGLIDGDIVSLSNLARQILYDTKDIGEKKVFIAKKKLKSLNPDVKIDSYPIRLNEEVASHIFIKYDCIIDATDNFETRYLINKMAVRLDKPLFIGAVGRFTGQVMDVLPHKTACYNCVFPEKETVEFLTRRNASMGVIGTLVGIIGSIVANEVLKFILKIGENYFNKLLIYDALDNSFSVLKVERDPRCKVCSEDKIL